MRLNHQHEVVEPFLAGLRAHPIPSLGIDTVLSVVPEGVDTGQVGVVINRHPILTILTMRLLRAVG